jgi:four helix bundle protein
MHNYKELKIWQKSVALAVNIYKRTRSFPKEELFGLTSQIRRSGISISSNIAEGAYRNSNNEFNHFLGVANGSAAEVDTQLFIAKELEFISQSEYEEFNLEITQIQKMNYTFQQTLIAKNQKS